MFTLLAFVLPLFAGTQISQYRSHALLVPGLLLLRHLPAWLLVPLAVPSALLAYKMAVLFFSWLLM